MRLPHSQKLSINQNLQVLVSLSSMALLSLHVLDDEGFVLYKADVVEVVEQNLPKAWQRAANQF